MGLLDWLAKRMKSGEAVVISAQDIEEYIDGQELQKVCSLEFFISVAVDLIANLYGTAETCTYLDGEERRAEEYYIWNYQPNRNQSAVEFKKELVSCLFLKNEVLIVEEGRQLIIADGFSVKEDNVLQDKIFTSVTKGNWASAREYRMSDVIYIKLHNRNVISLLNSVYDGYRRIAEKALKDYETANGRKGILHVETTAQNKKYGSRGFNEVYQELITERFRDYFKSQNAVLPLYDGFNYSEQGSEGRSSRLDSTADYIKIINEQAAKTGLAFQISPQLLIGNVEGLKDAVDNTLMFCIKPLARQIDEAINRARYGKKVLKGCYVRTETASIRYIDIFSVAEKVDKLVASGFASIDELRRITSMEEVGTEGTRKHYITKNYEDLEKRKGEKNNGNQNGGG